MTTTEETPPKQWEHCLLVFSELRKSAVAVSVNDGSEEGRHALVWEGFLTKLFRRLDMPQPYYTSVMKRLTEMGCVRQLSRGGGAAPSRWELLDDPDYESFHEIETTKRAGTSRIGIVEARLSDQNTRVEQLEQRLEMVERALRD